MWASITRLTRALLSLSWARVQERVRAAIASPRPGAAGMRWDLVRAETGRTGGGEEVGVLEGPTHGAEAGVGAGSGLGGAVLVVGTTLGESVGFLEGGGFAGATGVAGAGVCGRGERGYVVSCHLLKISRRLLMAVSWAMQVLSVASLMAVDKTLIAWRSLSL